MRFSTFAIAVIVSLAMSGAAWASQDTGPAPDSNAQSDLDQIVCKSGKPPLGSHLPGPRVCKTKRGWLAEQRESQDYVDFMQKKAATSCIGGCGG